MEINHSKVNSHQAEFQSQHRVPQVYWKKFGFKDHGIRYVSVLEKFKDQTEQKLIKEFTAETNIFDYSLIPEIELRRHFEMTCARIETEYNRIIDAIHKEKKLTDRHRLILCDFVTSLICRSERSRMFYKMFLKDREVREKFVDEITMFKEDMREYFDVLFWSLEIEEQVKLIMSVLASHFSHCFKNFKCVILKSPTVNGRGWPTSDNPVVFDQQNNFNYILPLETEIYLPLSKHYCLFMYHEGSEETTNPLRSLQENLVHKCDASSHDFICWKIRRNIHKFLVFPGKFEYNFLTDK
jgi:hypothetical protein